MNLVPLRIEQLSNVPLVKKVSHTLSIALAIGALVCAAVSIGLAILTIRQGLDLSDEAFNYLLIRDSSTIEFALRFHGFLLTPIDQLLGGSLTGIRIVSLIISLVLFSSLCWIVLLRHPPEVGWVFALIIVCGATAFGWDRLWFLRTPTYITVATWGCALYLIGLVVLVRAIAETAPGKHFFVSAFFLALGVMVTGLARPPSGLLLVLISTGVLIYYLLRDAQQRRGVLTVLVYAIGISVLLMLFLGFCGLTPFRAIDLWQTAIELRSSFSESQPFLTQHLSDMLWLDNKRHGVVNVLLLSVLSLIWTVAYASWGGPRWRFLAWPSLLLSAALWAHSVYRLSPIGLNNFFHQDSLSAEVFAFALSWVAFGAAFHVARKDTLPPHFLVAIGCLLVPLIVVFGTGSQVFVQMINSVSFYGLGVILISVAQRQALFTAFACFCVAMVSLQFQIYGMHKPYRLFGSIPELTTSVRIGDMNEIIFEHPDTASFYKMFQNAIEDRDLAKGTYLFDLTGSRPGMSLILSAKAPVYPWIASGYKNSPDLLRFIWNKTPEIDRKTAWLLGPVHDSFREDSVGIHFANLNGCYEQVVSGIEPRFDEEVTLWKPRTKSGDYDCFGTISE